MVSNGTIVSQMKNSPVPKSLTKTIKLKKIKEDIFSIKSRSNLVNVNVINMMTEIITEKVNESLSVKDGNVIPSPDKDVWKVAALDRTFSSGKHAVGFMKNFGANSLIETQGGMVVVRKGKILSFMPLQLGGIISTDSFENVSENFANLNNVLADAGCKFKKPHLIPLFLPFLALPEIRILSTGLVDVKSRSLLRTIIS